MPKAETESAFALVGAGPAGLATARNLQRRGIPFVGFEKHSDVGGLWDIANPHSTVYESAHLISSKRMTEFTELPMDDGVADYPSHRELRDYFHHFADHFELRPALSIRHRSASHGTSGRWLARDQSLWRTPTARDLPRRSAGQRYAVRAQSTQFRRPLRRSAAALRRVQVRFHFRGQTSPGGGRRQQRAATSPSTPCTAPAASP